MEFWKSVLFPTLSNETSGCLSSSLQDGFRIWRRTLNNSFQDTSLFISNLDHGGACLLCPVQQTKTGQTPNAKRGKKCPHYQKQISQFQNNSWLPSSRPNMTRTRGSKRLKVVPVLRSSHRVVREMMSLPQKNVSFLGKECKRLFTTCQAKIKSLPGSSRIVRGPGRKKVTVRAWGKTWL